MDASYAVAVMTVGELEVSGYQTHFEELEYVPILNLFTLSDELCLQTLRHSDYILLIDQTLDQS